MRKIEEIQLFEYHKYQTLIDKSYMINIFNIPYASYDGAKSYN